jgi:WXG100 family type VII secretion target
VEEEEKMANLNVTYADMKDAAARLLQGKDEMTGKLNELASLVSNLVSNGFQTDQASHAFNDTFTDFQTGTTKAVEALQGLSDFLNAAAEAMQNTDSELSRAIQS